MAELILATIGFLLTLMVFSYFILGDNALFRAATYTFVGVAAAYVALIALRQVLWPKLILPLIAGSFEQRLLLAVPLFLSLLLLAKIFPVTSRVGNVPMGYLVGSAAAVAIGGAVLGTIFPQVLATAGLFDLGGSAAVEMGVGGALLDGLFVLVGVVSTLLFFYFGVNALPSQPPRRPALVDAAAKLGQYFIALTFGAVFAGVFMAALSALVERVSSLVDFVLRFGV